MVTAEITLVEQPNKRAERAAATRQRLIEAAMRLFAEQGYAASSVAAIGEVAGVSRGLVNFHFATKENLLDAVIDQLMAELEGQLFPSDPPQDPFEAVVLLVQAHHRFLVEQPERARLVFRLQAEELNPRLGLTAFAELHRRWLERTRPWWQQGLSQGLIDRTLDHNAVVTFTVGALRGIALEWLLAPEVVDLDAAYDYLLRSLSVSLNQPPTRTSPKRRPAPRGQQRSSTQGR